VQVSGVPAPAKEAMIELSRKEDGFWSNGMIECCNGALDYYFVIPKNAMKVWLRFHKKKPKGSDWLEVFISNPPYLRVGMKKWYCFYEFWHAVAKRIGWTTGCVGYMKVYYR
jgi:hypothetical protein